ncbi:peptidase S8/S53 domain-containing protein [Syncephalis plumigaleata]|nr:peptidase S8/S53 domain-containing protein [Syncephalis plumigaleata]
MDDKYTGYDSRGNRCSNRMLSVLVDVDDELDPELDGEPELPPDEGADELPSDEDGDEEGDGDGDGDGAGDGALGLAAGDGLSGFVDGVSAAAGDEACGSASTKLTPNTKSDERWSILVVTLRAILVEGVGKAEITYNVQLELYPNKEADDCRVFLKRSLNQGEEEADVDYSRMINDTLSNNVRLTKQTTQKLTRRHSEERYRIVPSFLQPVIHDTLYGKTVTPMNTYATTGVMTARSYDLYGRGIKIGIIDSGIDFRHPALGGKFGPGHTVAYGYNFVNNSYRRGANQVEADSLLDCIGHGTRVAGILAARTKTYVGIAPNATLGAYRIFGCIDAPVQLDTVKNAFEKAYDDGMHIICPHFRVQASNFGVALAKLMEFYTNKGVIVIFPTSNRLKHYGVVGIIINDMRLSIDKSRIPIIAITPGYIQLLMEAGKNVNYVELMFNSNMNYEPQVEGIPNLSTLALQQQLSMDIIAPAGPLFTTTFTQERYEIRKDMSLASAYMCGVAALFIELHELPNGERINPVVFKNAMKNAAIPHAVSSMGMVAPVLKQGAGLVRLDRAIAATFGATPTTLELGDIKAQDQYGKVKAPVTIHNYANYPVTYTISHLPALSLSNIGTNDALLKPPRMLQNHATATLLPPVTVHGAHSYTFTAELYVPNSSKHGDNIVYSGYIVIDPAHTPNSSPSDQAVYVPYIWFNGDYQAITRKLLFSTTKVW